jgi:hypothetical protein
VSAVCEDLPALALRPGVTRMSVRATSDATRYAWGTPAGTETKPPAASDRSAPSKWKSASPSSTYDYIWKLSMAGVCGRPPVSSK